MNHLKSRALIGLRHRLRISYLYDLYSTIVDGRSIQARNGEVAFYRSILAGFKPGDLVFDVGANVGDKTDVFLRLGARVIAIEPDEHNQDILRYKFVNYRLSPKPVIILGQALGDKVGTETMWLDGPGSALNTLSRKWADTLKSKARTARTLDICNFEGKTVPITTLQQLEAQYGNPFFIKVDVEGYELQVLRGLRSPVPYVSFEVNLPEFREEGRQCLQILENLSSRGEFNYATDCPSGLALKEWVDKDRCAELLDSCKETCIEIFWRRESLPRDA
jgi:FkbM family methyltransferase